VCVCVCGQWAWLPAPGLISTPSAAGPITRTTRFAYIKFLPVNTPRLPAHQLPDFLIVSSGVETLGLSGVWIALVLWVLTHLCSRCSGFPYLHSCSALQLTPCPGTRTDMLGGGGRCPNPPKKGTHRQNDLSIDHCNLKLARNWLPCNT